jgi:hypothetical protein
VHKELAKVTGTMLGPEDHGIMTCMLYVDYENGSAQGIGGYDLRGVGAGKFIEHLIAACGVRQWEDIGGQTIYVLRESERMNARVLGVQRVVFGSDRSEPFTFADFWAEQLGEDNQ